jgi:hypothetical protein
MFTNRETSGLFVECLTRRLSQHERIRGCSPSLRASCRDSDWIHQSGYVPADLVAIDISTWVNGHAVPGGLGKPHLIMSLGLLAPNAPCYLAAIFPPKYVSAIEHGASKTVVSVRTSYKDATGRLYCFRMNYMYYAPLRKYDPEGGGTDCTSDAPAYSEATTHERQMSSGSR